MDKSKNESEDRRTVLSFDEKLKVADWIRKNKNNLEGKSFQAVADDIYMDTGVKASAFVVRSINQAVGAKIGARRPNGGIGSSTRFQQSVVRDAELARCIRAIGIRLNEEFGGEFLKKEEIDLLTKLVGRRLTGDVNPQTPQ